MHEPKNSVAVVLGQEDNELRSSEESRTITTKRRTHDGRSSLYTSPQRAAVIGSRILPSPLPPPWQTPLCRLQARPRRSLGRAALRLPRSRPCDGEPGKRGVSHGCASSVQNLHRADSVAPLARRLRRVLAVSRAGRNHSGALLAAGEIFLQSRVLVERLCDISQRREQGDTPSPKPRDSGPEDDPRWRL